MPEHSELEGLELHQPFNYIQEVDPGAVGAGKYWLVLSGDNVPGQIKKRDTTNTFWQQVAIPQPYSLSTDAGEIGWISLVGAEDIPGEFKLLAIRANDGVEITVSAGTVTFHDVRYLLTPPATAASEGTKGQYSSDASFFYICTAADTWKRVAIAAW